MAETGKQSSYKKLFSNTLVFAIGSFSSKVLVLLLVPIYTNYLTTAELDNTSCDHDYHGGYNQIWS